MFTDNEEDVKMREGRIKQLQRDFFEARLHIERTKATGIKEPLIKGEFTAEEARLLLKSLFRSKIQMHTNASFSSMLRTGEESSVHNLRKKELIASLQRLEKVFEKKSNANASFKINCLVSITKKEVKKK
eukprot:gene4001-5728_t